MTIRSNLVGINLNYFVLFCADLMDLQQSFYQPEFGFHSDEDESFKEKPSSISAPSVASDNIDGCFDCNICLEAAHDPVVSFCGHLYCWPCIYKWLEVQSSSPESDEQPKCPVCKTCISNSSFIPLYGRGTAAAPGSVAKKGQFDLVVPHRPAAVGNNTLVTETQPHPHLFHPQPEHGQHQHYFEPEQQGFHQQAYLSHPFGNYATGSSGFGNLGMTSTFSPTIEMFGEMVFPGMFGSSGTNLFTYSYPNSYPPRNGSRRRIRRQQMQVEKSLSRVTLFLFFCLLLCLLLF